jgi:hypothetical protein
MFGFFTKKKPLPHAIILDSGEKIRNIISEINRNITELQPNQRPFLVENISDRCGTLMLEAASVLKPGIDGFPAVDESAVEAHVKDIDRRVEDAFKRHGKYGSEIFSICQSHYAVSNYLTAFSAGRDDMEGKDSLREGVEEDVHRLLSGTFSFVRPRPEWVAKCSDNPFSLHAVKRRR